MSVLWGIAVTALSFLAWGGQALSWLAPATAVRVGVMEAEDDVELTFWADMRGEAVWDTFTLWTMAAAGILLTADRPAWPYFGLVGGGIFLYFAGRGVLARASMRRLGLRIGTRRNVRVAFVFNSIWAMMAIVTIIAAVRSLET